MRPDLELTFRFEWESAPGVRAPELSATWARLEVWVGDDCVTHVEDRESQSTRRSIYVPLYPLAEWIAYNWWLLRADARPALALRSEAQVRRHSMRAAGDGFAWPDLVIVPEGRVTRLAWRRDVGGDSRPVRFFTDGEALVDQQSVEHSLWTLVESVITRLAEQGIGQTPLTTEWDQLKQTEAEEAEFCLAAARLGLDPYAEASDFEEEITRAADQLRGSVFEDFLDAVTPERIGAGLTWISDSRRLVEMGPRTPGDAIDQLRKLVRSQALEPDVRTPWDRGYRQAERVRHLLDIDKPEAFDLADLIESRVQTTADPGLQALGGAMRDAIPVVVLGRRLSEESTRFTLARGVWRVLYENDPLFLVTAAHTDRQRTERAFAAELLAPAEGVAQHLGDSSGTVLAEDLELAAQHFRVSPMVIQHQVENQLSLAVLT